MKSHTILGNRCLAVALLCTTATAVSISPSGAATSVAPPPGLEVSASDPSTGTVVGLVPNTAFAQMDTWVWKGAGWKQRAPGGEIPSIRTSAAMAYDAATKTVVLFGGQSGSSISAGNFRIHGDTFVYNGRTNSWSKETPEVSPPPRVSGTMAYDAAARTVLLFGGSANPGNHVGQLNDTWAWNGTEKRWTPQEVPVSPPPRTFQTMAEDRATKTVVLFGGLAPGSILLGDTWTWNGAAKTWTEQSPTSTPQARRFARMANDTARNNVVLFGGDNVNGFFTDTWTWNGTTKKWKQRAAGSTAPPRGGPAMSYHAGTQKVVLVTGTSPAETWLWNGTAWKRPL